MKKLLQNTNKYCSSDLNKEKYQSLRNRRIRVCRDAQRQHIHKSVVNVKMVIQLMSASFKDHSVLMLKSRLDAISRDLQIDDLSKHFSSSSNISIDDYFYLR